jgi:hypothetical protein
MKKQSALMAILAGLLLTTLLISGCGSILVTRNGDTGTGEMETRQFNFTEFTRVDIGSAFTYEIKQSPTYSISITAPENLFNDIKVAKEGQTLKIEKKSPWTPFNIGSERLRAVITMPRLYGLDSSGATKGVVTRFSSTDDLEVSASGASSVELVELTAGDIKFDVSGASDVIGTLNAKGIDFNISGASAIQLEGAAGDIDAEASGASRLNLVELTINNADVTLSGASSGTINLKGRLDIELSGASELEYIGEPLLGEMNMSGASTFKRK